MSPRGDLRNPLPLPLIGIQGSERIQDRIHRHIPAYSSGALTQAGRGLDSPRIGGPRGKDRALFLIAKIGLGDHVLRVRKDLAHRKIPRARPADTADGAS